MNNKIINDGNIKKDVLLNAIELIRNSNDLYAIKPSLRQALFILFPPEVIKILNEPYTQYNPEYSELTKELPAGLIAVVENHLIPALAEAMRVVVSSSLKEEHHQGRQFGITFMASDLLLNLSRFPELRPAILKNVEDLFKDMDNLKNWSGLQPDVYHKRFAINLILKMEAYDELDKVEDCILQSNNLDSRIALIENLQQADSFATPIYIRILGSLIDCLADKVDKKTSTNRDEMVRRMSEATLNAMKKTLNSANVGDFIKLLDHPVWLKPELAKGLKEMLIYASSCSLELNKTIKEELGNHLTTLSAQPRTNEYEYRKDLLKKLFLIDNDLPKFDKDNLPSDMKINKVPMRGATITMILLAPTEDEDTNSDNSEYGYGGDWWKNL